MLRYTLITVAVLVLACLVLAVRAIAGVTGPNIVHPPTTAPVERSASTTQPTSPLDFVVQDIDGHTVNLADYRGKVVMIVNVASHCGFTPQYAALEKCYETYKDRGFVILGFPANNFKGQEPGTNEQIKAFCTAKYNVTFPMMSKISVAGDDQAPLYKFLTEPATAGPFAGPIGWNFNKFLVDRNGNLFARFPTKTSPTDKVVTDAIEAALNQQTAG